MDRLNKIKDLYHKHYEMVSYLFFGGLTTLVSFVTYAVCAKTFLLSVVISNIISWILSVLFAYVTNRSFVFKSDKKGFIPIIGEMASFFGSRLLSGAFETLLMFIFVDLLNFYDLIIKVVATIIVVILNYIFSKLFVFKSKSAK